MNRANCRSCNAAVIWLQTVAGKRMPVDAEPAEDGTIDIRGGIADVLGGDRLEDARAKKIPLRKSHFATCPQAGFHRRPKAAKEE